ncbi:MAG: tyramine oxidase subunit B [Negativicutes bacterium]
MQGKKTTFLYLSEKDMIEAGVLDGKKCFETIDEMFKTVGQGDYLLGGVSENEHGIRLFFPIEKRFPLMPVAGPDRRFLSLISYLGGNFGVCASKWYGSNIENPSRGLPRSILTVTLNDVETGEPLAFMSGNLISCMRTGAVPAVAAKYLATRDATVAAIIGAGVISRATITCLKAAVPELTKVVVYDLLPDKTQAFCREMSTELGIDFVAAESTQQAVTGADIIVIATSGGNKPLIDDKWVKDGAVIASQSGALLSEEMLTSSRIVFDEIKMHRAWEEEYERLPKEEASKKMGFYAQQIFELMRQGKIKDENVMSLGEVACAKRVGRTNEREKFIIINGGMGTEDAAWGYALYNNAKSKGIGTELVLWESPHWG